MAIVTKVRERDLLMMALSVADYTHRAMNSDIDEKESFDALTVAVNDYAKMIRLFRKQQFI